MTSTTAWRICLGTHQKKKETVRLHLQQERSPSPAFRLADDRMKCVRTWNLCTQASAAALFNTTPTDREIATENNEKIFFSVFPEHRTQLILYFFLSPGKHISAFQLKGCITKPCVQTLGSVTSPTEVCPKTRVVLGRSAEMSVQYLEQKCFSSI